MYEAKLKVNEVFLSVDGEVNHRGQGAFSIFVRFQGCNLKCLHCDTKQTLNFDDSLCTSYSPERLFSQIHYLGCKKVTLTGGEPLMQPRDSLIKLIMYLLDNDYHVSIETNGSVKPPHLFRRHKQLSWIVDQKMPSSGMDHAMDKEALQNLQKEDFIKMVIVDRIDFDFAKKVMIYLESIGCPAQIALSPCEVNGAFNAQQLVKWCINDRLYDKVVINMQLHKVFGLK